MLRPVNLALWWNLCQLILMVSVSLTPSLFLLCVNNTIHIIRVSSLFVSQSMLPPLPTLMSPHMPVTMMKPETPTWETGTVSTGWKTLMWLVHTSDRELCLGPDLRRIEEKSIYSAWAAVWSLIAEHLTTLNTDIQKESGFTQTKRWEGVSNDVCVCFFRRIWAKRLWPNSSRS